MHPLILTIAVAFCLISPDSLLAQQPEILHGQLSTHTASRGLSLELDTLKRENAQLWVGYSIPVSDRFNSGWGSNGVTYLEGGNRGDRDDDAKESAPSFNHADVLIRISGNSIERLQVESPDRKLDAGNLRVVWLGDITPGDSVATLGALAKQSEAKKLRDEAVFAISVHQTPEATPALIGLTAAGNELSLREKAAFWLVNQRGNDGFAAIERLARDDADPAFREKLTFDLSIAKDPRAVTELLRMAHSDTSPEVRKQAQFWVAQKGGKQVAGDLRQMAEDDPEARIRKSAVFAISQLPREEATTQLIQLAGTAKDPAVRKQAVFWLGQSDDPRALDYLTSLLKQ